MSLIETVVNGWILAAMITLPILAALLIARSVRSSLRRDREAFEEQVEALLHQVQERQEETNRLLRELLAR